MTQTLKRVRTTKSRTALLSSTQSLAQFKSEGYEYYDSCSYYKFLGLEPGSTLSEVKKAVRDKLWELHPDVGEFNAEEWDRLQRVSSVLLDPLKKFDYDTSTELPEEECKYLFKSSPLTCVVESDYPSELGEVESLDFTLESKVGLLLYYLGRKTQYVVEGGPIGWYNKVGVLVYSVPKDTPDCLLAYLVALSVTDEGEVKKAYSSLLTTMASWE